MTESSFTRSLEETVQARAQRDPAFRDVLLAEGVEASLSGEVDVGKSILRDYSTRLWATRSSPR